MDSEDDMHDANDVKSLDDDFYRGEREDVPLVYNGDYDDDDADDYFEDGDESDKIESRRPEQNFTILKESDIQQRQLDDITRVATVLFISRVDAAILLGHYKWNVSEVHEAWFANEEHVGRAVGLLEKPVVQFPNARELTCGICVETYPCSRIESTACGHPYCISLSFSLSCILLYIFYVAMPWIILVLCRRQKEGLSDVDSNGAASSKGMSSKNAAGSSKGRVGRGKGTTRTSSSNKMTDDSNWYYDHCTHANTIPVITCQICHLQRRKKFGSSMGECLSQAQG